MGACHRRYDAEKAALPSDRIAKSPATRRGISSSVNRTAIATLINRTTRFAMLVHLPRQTGYGLIKPKKNGPALAGYGAVTTKNALVGTFEVLPPSLRRSLAWDRGKGMSAHALLTREIGLPVYFAEAKSPWQRGGNEHLNGLLRQCFPKGSDISRWTTRELQTSADTINNRPRGILGWRTSHGSLRRPVTLIARNNCGFDRLNTATSLAVVGASLTTAAKDCAPISLFCRNHPY